MGREPDVAGEIRPLRGREEFEACVALQELTWGAGFADRVPASILMVAAETGGVVSGAFEEGDLIAFVFGITGLRDGRLVHWSDMLAVHPDHRSRGLGRALKRHQRDLLLARGVGLVLWTFDPLESRNAHLNLRRLGAFSRTYLRDLYGASDSPLHAGLGTDRLLVEWPITSARVEHRLESSAERQPVTDGAVAVEIPSDIQALKAEDPARARRWREVVRSELERRFGEGYVAVDFERGPGTSSYLLTRSFTA